MSSINPLVEITGVWLPNKGAELMAHATIAALSHRMPAVQFCSLNQGPPETRAAIGMPVWRSPHRWLTKHMERFPRAFHGAIRRLEWRGITHVLDISGFAYGDYWGRKKIKRRADMYLRLGKPLYLLPQSFGPFTNEDLRADMRFVIDNARVIAARDRQSLEYLRVLGSEREIAIQPDLTISLDISDRVVKTPDSPYACLIMNAMTIKSGAMEQCDLLSLYRRVADTVRRAGLLPVIVLHEPLADKAISEQLANECQNPPIVNLRDARDIKAYISRAACVVSGRYHGVVNALATGVPSFAVGWSHKYREILEDFAFKEGMYEGNADQFVAKIQRFVSSATVSEELRANLARIGARKKQQLAAFWDDVVFDMNRV